MSFVRYLARITCILVLFEISGHRPSRGGDFQISISAGDSGRVISRRPRVCTSGSDVSHPYAEEAEIRLGSAEPELKVATRMDANRTEKRIH